MREIDDLIERFGADAVIAALDPILTDERKQRIEQVLDARLSSLTIVLENLYDPHNGAATIRSAEGFGLCDVHAIETVTPFSVSEQVTIGAQKWIDVHRWRTVADCAAALRAGRFRLCATVPGAARTVGELDPAVRWAVAFGNEHEGLSEALRSVCDEAVSIPMVGFTQSLNLSVSVALVVSELSRRRREAVGVAGDLSPNRRANLRARWYAQGTRGAREIVSRYVSK